MVEVVGQRGVDVGQRNLWETTNDLLQREPLKVVSQGDVLHADERP